MCKGIIHYPFKGIREPNISDCVCTWVATLQYSNILLCSQFCPGRQYVKSTVRITAISVFYIIPARNGSDTFVDASTDNKNKQMQVTTCNDQARSVTMTLLASTQLSIHLSTHQQRRCVPNKPLPRIDSSLIYVMFSC